MSDVNVTNAAATRNTRGVTKINYSFNDKVFTQVNDLLLLIATLIVLYPLVYIVSSSFSSPTAVSRGQVVLWPVDFSIRGFQEVFSYKPIVSAFANTIFYTLVGTAVNVFMTLLASYPLSRKRMMGRRAILFLFSFTMIFNGGMIPTYILNSNLKLIDTRAVMIIPLALNVFNVIICRSFIESTIPEELVEAAQIDGCSHFRFLFQMVVPLSKAIIAVLVLYYALGHWNQYFQAFLYLSDRDKFPLQIILRDILVMNTVNQIIADPQLYAAKQGMADLLKYSLIVVASTPFMIAYPFVAKHFVKGVMIGSVKG